jgi:SRSO17 transposase
MFCTMLQRACRNGVPGRWVVADEVYGNDGKLRKEIENLDLGYVLTIPKTHRFLGACKVQAKDVACWWPTWAWKRLNAGDGNKGPRLYDWAFRSLPPSRQGWDRGLLIRRSIKDPEELAYFLTCAPTGTSLEKLVHVAGTRWSIETGFKIAKNEVGLDNYEVRTHTGWYRHITMCMIALVYLTLARNRLRIAEGYRRESSTLYQVIEYAHQQHKAEFAISDIPKPLPSTITLRLP